MYSQTAASPVSGTPPLASNQLLFVLRSADMTLTTDQVFTRIFAGFSYQITSVVACRRTGAFSVACLGGIYTGAGKTGDAMVAAAQSWAALTGANKIATATLAALVGTNLESATPFLSLTTGNSAAMLTDIFIYGTCLD